MLKGIETYKEFSVIIQNLYKAVDRDYKKYGFVVELLRYLLNSYKFSGIKQGTASFFSFISPAYNPV